MITTRIRVGVADDHPVVREGLVMMLQTQSDFEVVGNVGTGLDAIEMVERHLPNVLLLDLEMPGIDGVAVLRRLREIGTPTRVIVFTVFDTELRIVEAVEAGAVGYLLKGSPRNEIFDAIRTVSSGGSLLQPVVTSTVMRHLASRGQPVRQARATLTPREQAVLTLLARGKSNKEIAATLGVTDRTVKFHVSSIFTKLGASNRTQAVRRALQEGLVTL